MNTKDCPSNPHASARRTSWLAHCNLLPAVLAGVLLVHTPVAMAALTFGRGTPTVVGSIKFASSPDSVTITGALVGPGAINNGLNIPANRIQYDIINSDQGTVSSWTITYGAAVGPEIIGAFTPLGYITLSRATEAEGGAAYTTLFNAGYGVYTYNTGAPWIIDYEADHITFTSAGAPPTGLPANDGVGYLLPTPYLPSFAILFKPALGTGLVPASAILGTANLTGQVFGPVPGNNCLTIQCGNLIVQTCSNCISVPFNAAATDSCCSNVTLNYEPPSGTCFPSNSTNVVQVMATDACGNNATNQFTVTVLPGGNCGGTTCIDISCSNIVAVTCSDCAVVPFTATATDVCCPGAAGPDIVYSPPSGTCFPVNSTNLIQVTAYDNCGNMATDSFTVTVLPGANCGETNKCITLNCSNIVATTCSNCTIVPYMVNAVDTCCQEVNLVYNPPPGTCFPVNSTNVVEVMAYDNCRNISSNFFTVTILPGPNCGGTPSNCISILCSNIVALTCSNCATVFYSATVEDPCCPSADGPHVIYNPPATTCFPVNSTNLVRVLAFDDCGNGATNYFTVTVLPGPNCGGTSNCISISCSNVVALTCSNCMTVPFSASAVDRCCNSVAGGPSGVTIIYNPPTNTCFPVNSTNVVQVTAYDQCGYVATSDFTVTVLPGPNCGGNTCISISAPDVTVVTCSNCTTVPFAATASDACCSSVAQLIYNPPPTTCFPLNSTNVVQVIASDECNHAATNYFLVTVLPGPNCLSFGGPNNGSGTGYSSNPLTLTWPVSNGQLQQSTDLINWSPVPGVTNSQYMVTNSTPRTFYRLQYH
jgi:hypothetical protein